MGPLTALLRRISVVSAAWLRCLAASAILWGAALLAPAARAGEAPEDSARTAPVATAAEEPRYRLEPVIVTAERFPIPLARVPADATVIDRARLELDRPLLLADALRQVPGLDVQRSGNLGKLTDVRLRGADPRHTLVLFEGIPLNGPWLGSFDFADLAGAGLGRVEIVGGPTSSLYGSSAVGGVIQLLADEEAAPGLRGFAEYGEQSTLRQGVGWDGRLGRAKAGVSMTHLVSNGLGPRDGYNGTSAQLHVEVPLRRAGRLRVNGVATRGRKELPHDFAFDFTDFLFHQIPDPDNEETDRLAAGRTGYLLPLTPHASLEAELSGLAGRIENRNEPSGPAGDYQRTALDNTRGIAALRARVSADARAQAVLGVEYRAEHAGRDDNSKYGGFGDTTRVDEGIHSRAAYVQAHFEPAGRLCADAGIRLEDHSRHGAYGVPRLTVAVAMPEAGVRLRGGYGRAFTAPTLTDLFYPGYGSPTLRPERSRTWEGGMDGRWLGGGIEARATWHTTRFRDLIQSNSFFVADNVGRARIEGEEYSVRVEPDRRVMLAAWAAHLVTKSLMTGGPLPKRPDWRVGIAADVRPVPAATLTAAWRWVDPVADPFVFVDATGRLLAGPTPGYAALDLGALLSLGRWMPADLRLRVSNALDREYSEVKGFPARGRTFTVGVTLSP